MQDLRLLLHGLMQKKEEVPKRRADCYYLQRTSDFPVNLLVWVYRPQTTGPRGDQLADRKLVLEWAGPYMYKGMASSAMAKIA